MTSNTLKRFARRKLRFKSLEQVVLDVDRLTVGHATVGRWSLGEILNHLTTTIHLSIDGPPTKRSLVVRRLVGPVVRQMSLWLQWIPEGISVPPGYLPQPNSEFEKEADALRQAVERFCAHGGSFDEHPLMGRLSAEQWERFHRLHCAHHLSFAIPAS
jgi:hypothetical protein